LFSPCDPSAEKRDADNVDAKTSKKQGGAHRDILGY
jgi:hypothetical protein